MSANQWPPYTQPYITYPVSEPKGGSFQAPPPYDGYHALPALIYPHPSNSLYPDQSQLPNLAYPGPQWGTHLPPLQYPHPEGARVEIHSGPNQTGLTSQHIDQHEDSPKTPSAPLLDEEEENDSYLEQVPTKQDDTDRVYESVEDHSLTREIEVMEISENATKDILLNFFEDERTGGGPVADIKYTESDRTAIVIFESLESVNTILKRQPCILLGKAMIIRVRTSADEDCMTPVSAMTNTTNKGDNSEWKDSTSSICVSGFKDTTPEETFIYYFENKMRSGGGEISSHQMNREEGYISITFDQSTDAAEVLKRSHTVDGMTLTVRPYILDTKTMLVTGLTGTISEDTLLNFMEVKAKAEVKFVTFSEDKTKAVVEFENPCDFHQIKETCAKYKLEGVHLAVCPVPKCNSVKVTCLPSQISEDTLIHYFENKRRSGGDTVERVELDPNIAVCLVYFQNEQVIEEVCRRSHVIEKTHVEVCPYHSCLGKLKVEEKKEFPPRPVTVTYLYPEFVIVLWSMNWPPQNCLFDFKQLLII